MLVLSRRTDQRVVFPNVGITLNVLKVRGQVVKLGIEAPDDVEILRPEAKNRRAATEPPRADLDRHDLRGRINNLRLALAVFDRQRALGRNQDAEQTFQRVIKLLSDLDAQLTSSRFAAPRPTADPQTRLRLLVVEDDANERELLAGLLRLYGYEVDVAPDGDAALELLDKQPPPDLVLLDINMPNRNGMDVIEQIRADSRFASLPVFAVSGADPDAFGSRSDLSRLNGWFPKPVDPARLLSEIRAARHTPAKL